MDTRSKRSYEEIDPAPQNGWKRFLHTVLIGVFTICVTVMVVVLLNTFTSSSTTGEIISNGLKSELRASSGDNANAESGIIAETAPPAEDIVVELDKGAVRGKIMKSRAGRDYLVFKGIPYAKPPLGKLRFQPPVENDAWDGILDATEFKPDCIQKDKYNKNVFRAIGSEDCLYMNVFTPKSLGNLKARSDSKRFPVLVYIHGGRQYGSATRYGAEYFMDEDVVMVSFHYRLGVLGNLNTKDMNARGNQGLKDQVMALEWVQDNVEHFGGDKRKVTIFGNSFGAIHVSSHLLSPMSKGLFHRAICQSGTVLMPLTFSQNPLEPANQLAKELNFTGTTTAELVQFFRDTSAEKLVLTSYLMEFGTSVEPPADTDDVFLSDTPVNLLQAGQINRATAIFGVVASEGLMNSLPILTDANKTESFNENWAEAAVPALKLNNSPTLKDPERIANAAREFYFGENKLSRDTDANFTDMFSDREFIHPANVFATFQLEKNPREDNVYLYRFNVQTDKSYGDSLLADYGPDRWLGSGHADELQFQFPFNAMPPVPMGSKFANFSQMMIRLWVTFADTGNPTGADNGAEWLPIDKQKPYRWFDLSKDPKMIDSMGDRMNFWDTFDLTDLYF